MRDRIIWRLTNFLMRFASEEYRSVIKGYLVFGVEMFPLYVDFYERYVETLETDPFYGLVDLRAENPHFYARAEKMYRKEH